jgi:gliding motility-associated lipoprotein GldD
MLNGIKKGEIKMSAVWVAGIFALVCSLLSSCNSVYTPKRRGYFKIDFPPHQYQAFDKPGYPYTFEYPLYADVVRDTSFFDKTPENPYWINIDFPRFGARIYISYKVIGLNSFDKLRDDAFKMTFKHSYKASSIEPSVIYTPNGVSGIFFDVGGNAATAKQFYLTDSTKHFLRGALYFDTAPNEDSLGIVNAFLEKDMEHLINTFRWRDAATGDAPGGQLFMLEKPGAPAGPSSGDKEPALKK